MDEEEFWESIGIRRARVKWDLDLYAGVGHTEGRRSSLATEGRRLPEEIEQGDNGVVASSFRRAAASALLIGDWSRADRYFRSAAENYRILRLPYGMLMAACLEGRLAPDDLSLLNPRKWASQDADAHVVNAWYGNKSNSSDTQRWDSAHSEYIELGAPQLQYLLLTAKAMEAQGIYSPDERLNQIEVELQGRRTRAVGVLGLPVRYYLEISRALQFAEQGAAQLESALFPLVAAYDSAVRIAADNKYMWENMLMPFHPLEPDVIAPLRLVVRAAPWVREWIQKLPLSRITLRLLDWGLAIPLKR